MMKPVVTADRLKSLLHYDPDSGQWIWRVKRGGGGGKVREGSRAGHADAKTGYVRILIDGRMYLAHRLAFLYMTGAWPKEESDHIDNNPSNNRWSNLREATRSQNAANRRLQSNTSSGLKGVHWSKKEKKWTSQISISGVSRRIGCFDTKEAAAEAYKKASVSAFGEFSQ